MISFNRMNDFDLLDNLSFCEYILSLIREYFVSDGYYKLNNFLQTYHHNGNLRMLATNIDRKFIEKFRIVEERCERSKSSFVGSLFLKKLPLGSLIRQTPETQSRAKTTNLECFYMGNFV